MFVNAQKIENCLEELPGKLFSFADFCRRVTERRFGLLGAGDKRALSWPSRSRSVVYLGLEPTLLAGSQLHPLSIGILLKCDFLNKN